MVRVKSRVAGIARLTMTVPGYGLQLSCLHGVTEKGGRPLYGGESFRNTWAADHWSKTLSTLYVHRTDSGGQMRVSAVRYGQRSGGLSD